MKSFPLRINPIHIVVVVLVFVLGWQLGHWDVDLQWKNFKPDLKVSNQQPPTDKQNIDFKLFWDVWSLVSSEYVDKKAIDPQKMYYGAIQGMVAALGDPYTVFLPPESQKSTKEELGGSFEGVGIQLGFNKEKRLVVIAPLKDTPADKAGVQAGDIILKIEDKDTTNVTLPEAVNLIRGEKSTKVNLEIYREGDEKPRTVSLQRDTIVVKSVEYSLKESPDGKKIGYIKLSRFGERTDEEWNEAVRSALGDSVEGVVLDMRNNPGGYLDGAVSIGSEFIEEGDIVKQENSQGQQRGYKVNRAGRLIKMPITVLINKGSASASEIVAGAIQDYKRGKLVGEQSFGKGTIQESQDLPGGTGIHITTAKWLTPDGRWIHNEGLTPDVKIELDTKDPATDEQLDAALKTFDAS